MEKTADREKWKGIMAGALQQYTNSPLYTGATGKNIIFYMLNFYN